MTLRHLAELSALVALQGEQWIVLRQPLSDAILGQYLQSARERQLGWRTASQRITLSTPRDGVVRAGEWLDLLAEVLVTELLTRVWSAVLCAGDDWRGAVHAGPIARHVLAQVLEARTQQLSRLVHEECSPVGTLLEADLLRRKFDRWTDLLIGELSVKYDVVEFAVDRSRASEFRAQSGSATLSTAAVTRKLLTAGLRRAVGERSSCRETAAPHRDILHLVLTTLPNTPLDVQRRLQVPAGWPIRRAAAQTALPAAVAARLRGDEGPRSPAEALQDLLRRLEQQSPPGTQPEGG